MKPVRVLSLNRSNYAMKVYHQTFWSHTHAPANSVAKKECNEPNCYDEAHVHGYPDEIPFTMDQLLGIIEIAVLFGMNRIRCAAIDLLCRRITQCTESPMTFVDDVYRKTPESSTLRILFLDLFTFYRYRNGLWHEDINKHADKLPREFLAAYAKRISNGHLSDMKHRLQDYRQFHKHDLCKYHDHADLDENDQPQLRMWVRDYLVDHGFVPNRPELDAPMIDVTMESTATENTSDSNEQGQSMPDAVELQTGQLVLHGGAQRPELDLMSMAKKIRELWMYDKSRVPSSASVAVLPDPKDLLPEVLVASTQEQQPHQRMVLGDASGSQSKRRDRKRSRNGSKGAGLSKGQVIQEKRPNSTSQAIASTAASATQPEEGADRVPDEGSEDEEGHGGAIAEPANKGVMNVIQLHTSDKEDEESSSDEEEAEGETGEEDEEVEDKEDEDEDEEDEEEGESGTSSDSSDFDSAADSDSSVSDSPSPKPIVRAEDPNRGSLKRSGEAMTRPAEKNHASSSKRQRTA